MGNTTGKEIVQQIEAPTMWCGGRGGECHDVSIILVPNEINGESSNATDHPKETLAVLKVHSGRLSKCSKYFETCLNERWKKPSSSSSSLEFVLETHTDVVYYGDCFLRMYKQPFHKSFKDVEYCLGLLKVASQIQYHELMDSILLHLSSKAWSDADATMIVLYSASPDFPRQHAQDLVVRLGMDENKAAWHDLLCNAVERCIRSSLHRCFDHHRALIQELLPSYDALNGGPGRREGGADSGVTRDVVRIVSRETTLMLASFDQECNEKTSYALVPGFEDKLTSICWILEVLLAAKVAEAVGQCFVHLRALPKIPNHRFQLGLRLARVVLVMYREVVAGNLLLKAPERTALFENWYLVLKSLLDADEENLHQVTMNLFSTLPLQQRTDQFLKSQVKGVKYEGYFNAKSLAKDLKKRWPDMKNIAGEGRGKTQTSPSAQSANSKLGTS